MVAAIAIASPPKSSVLQNPINLKDPTSNFFGAPLKGLFPHLKPSQQRRNFANLVVASTSTAVTTRNSNNPNGRFYFNFTGFPFPLGPFLNRRTIRTEVSKPFLLLHHFLVLTLNWEFACL